MPDQYYDSTLTGRQLDAAFLQMQNIQQTATQVQSNATAAAQSASLIEENLSAIQAAPSNAQAAQQAAVQAAASASAAEDAAERAEQIADFNPADFATAAQGALAETAVQPDALDAYALKTDVPDTPADIGAATAAQGAKADTAVQSVNGAKPDSSGNVQLDLTTGTVRSVNGKDPDGSGNVQLSAGDVGAATAAQGAKADTALQPGALNGYAQTSDIPTELPNPQELGIRLGSGGSVTAYDGSVARTVTITPETIGAQPAGAASGGGKMTLLVTNNTAEIGSSAVWSLSLSNYDAVGIEIWPDTSASDTTYTGQVNLFPVPQSGTETHFINAPCITSNGAVRMTCRRISISQTRVSVLTTGYYDDWLGGGAGTKYCVPHRIYGIKF